MYRSLLLIAVVCSCGNGVDRSIGRVSWPRILAVKAEPPEATPGAAVTYTAIVAVPNGELHPDDLTWAFCTTAPTRAESGPASQACMTRMAPPDGSGTTIVLTTPTDACRRFGPLGLPAQNATTPSQPMAPDSTGGYYQPLRLDWQDQEAAAFERLTCDPTGVSLDLAQAYRAARQANRNPQLTSLVALTEEQTVTNAVRVTSTVDLRATWSTDSVESYVSVDPEKALLRTQTERLWVAWFATDGILEHDVGEDDGPTSANRWQAPSSPGISHIWAVLHDDRGGTDVQQIVVTAE